jgi:SRSO17 transposase
VRGDLASLIEGALMNKADLESLRPELDTYLLEYHDLFKTYASRGHLDVFVSGQLGPLQRKSIEPIALDADVAPRTLQEFFSIHSWDADSMRTRVREIVARDHADSSAVGIIDETSHAKKGDQTTGIQRQWCGEKGKVDNCLQTVNLTYAVPGFATTVDNDIFLPEGWIADRERCEAAGVPEGQEFRPKWRIALDLIERTLGDGVHMDWITADEFYGRSSEFLNGVEALGPSYVVESPRNIWGWTPRGVLVQRKRRRVDALFARGGPAWETYHVKDTTNGPLVLRARATRFVPSWSLDKSQELWLVMTEDVLSGERKYFLSNAPEETPLATLLAVAFARWNVERNFEDAKQEIGLGHFEVRKHIAVQRHLAVSMVSLLFLARQARRLRGEKGGTMDFVTGSGCHRIPA